MAYTPHLYLTFGGTLGGAEDEIWQCGIRVMKATTAGEDPIVPDELDSPTYLEHAVPLITEWFESATARITTDAQMEWVKCAAIGADGLYMYLTDPAIDDFGSPVTGGDGFARYPYQITKVMSWKTAISRGRASNGRIYLPLPSNALVPDTGKVTVDAAEATAGAELIEALRLVTGVDTYFPSVVSKVAAEWSKITRVRVGDVLDTQRRRRNALIETYVETAV